MSLLLSEKSYQTRESLVCAFLISFFFLFAFGNFFSFCLKKAFSTKGVTQFAQSQNRMHSNLYNGCKHKEKVWHLIGLVVVKIKGLVLFLEITASSSLVILQQGLCVLCTKKCSVPQHMALWILFTCSLKDSILLIHSWVYVNRLSNNLTQETKVNYSFFSFVHTLPSYSTRLCVPCNQPKTVFPQ